MRSLLYTITTFLILGVSLNGQDSLGVIDGRLLEELLENNEEQSFDFLSLYEELETYLKNPLNINTATEEDLIGMNMLTSQQVYDILDYRDNYGDFLTKYELQVIRSIDMGTLRALVPLVSVGNDGNVESFKSLFKEAQQNLFIKYKRVLEEKEGYSRPIDEGGYVGSPDHLYMRYHLFSGQKLRMGMTMEKDAGEDFFKGSNKNGFDYYSAFFYMRDVTSWLSAVSIGDYSISLGQGLILHNSFGAGKSSYVMNVIKGGRSLRPYSSVNEANFFRGGAATLDLSKNISSTLFFSSKMVDGSGIVKDSLIDTGFGSFNTVNVSGLHRSPSEIEKEKTIHQINAGGNIKYDVRNFSIGLNMMYTKFDTPVLQSDDLYKKYNFSGTELINTSVDYTYRFKNFSFFGEVAMSDNTGMGQIHGLMMSMGRKIDASIVYRNYAKDYQVLDANAFSESTLPINEQGVYFGLQFKPTREFTISTYFDQWKHPWLRFRKDAPSLGKEFLVKLDYSKRRQYNVYLQYKYETKQENGSGDAYIDPLVYLSLHRSRLHFAYDVTKEIELRSRLEHSYYLKEDDHSQGYLLYQDVIYKPIGSPISFTGRYAIFETDDFNSRIYAYENDILYEFSIPFYSGRGSRFYFNTRYRVNRMITAEMHYGYVLYQDAFRDPEYGGIGSGLENIDGNRRSDIKFQVKFKF